MTRANYPPIIIGAGVTGLVRALMLADAGDRPVIIDPENPGGKVRSVLTEGFTLEQGAATLVERPALRSLLERLNLVSKIRYPAISTYEQYVWYRGRIVPVPKSPPALIKSPLLSAWDKLSLPVKLLRKVPVSETDSVEDLISRLVSRRAAAAIVRPVMRGIFGGEARLLLAAKIFPSLYAVLAAGGSPFKYLRAQSGGRKIFCIEGGNETLVRALSAELNGKADFVRSAARAVTFNNGRFEVHTGERLFESDRLSIATAGPASGAFISGMMPDLAARLAELRYSAVTVVHLAAGGALRLPERGFGVLFPQEAGSALLGILFYSELFPHTAPQGQKLLTVCFGGIGETIQRWDEKEAALQAQDAVGRFLSAGQTSVLAVKSWPQAILQYEKPLLAVHALMQQAEERYKGLEFIGADVGGIGVISRIERAQKGTSMTLR